ncbi:MAG: hypothetical protein U0V74_03685 [Chitinophagales bacterium]
MDIINQLVCALNKEELRYFKIFAKRMVDSEERKDFLLLDYMRKSGDDYDDDLIAAKLYGKNNKDSFYRLKNRLLDYLGDYLTFHHTWKGDINEMNRNLSLYSIFKKRNQLKLAQFYLKKAEQKAIGAEDFEMLDVIYSHYIKLSNELMDINPELYIDKRRLNAERLNKIREMDQALAALSYRLKVTQNIGSGKHDALKILNATLKEFTSDEALKTSKSFQTRIYRAVSQILLQQHNYTALEKFLKETFSSFEKQKWFDRDNHDTKLQMLTYLVNSLFRLNNYKESLSYAELLGQEIKSFNGLLFDKYLFFYYNSLVINYSALDKNRALSILEEFERETRNKKNSYYDQFLYFNKAMLLHQSGKAEDAVRNIVKLYVNDNFKKADEAFKLKIAVAELIMHFDAGDPESYLLRSASVKRQFKKLLSGGDFKRDKQLLALMDKMVMQQNFRTNANLKRQAESFVKTKVAAGTVDSEIIRYNHWLAAKWKFSQS